MSFSVNEKVVATRQIEDPETNLKEARIVLGDYSGAIAKVDEREIALVRKLDWRIMPTLWCMYFMNYVRSSMPHILMNE